MKKRLLALVLGSCVALSALVGCSGAAAPAAAPTPAEEKKEEAPAQTEPAQEEAEAPAA